jgi:peroxiredoxin
VSARAPDFTLPGVERGSIRLSDLFDRDAGAVILFVHADCPTSLLALERLGPLGPALERQGVRLVVIAEEPLEEAARLVRRTRVDAVVLSQGEPFEVSRAYGVEAVPTTIRIDASGVVTGAVVGWDADALDGLLPVTLPRDAPTWKPGCESRSTFSAELLAAERTDAHDEIEEMYERGWTDGLPVVPPTRDRVERMLGGRDPSVCLGLVPPAMGEATLERIAACAVLAGCRPEYFPVILAAVEAALDQGFNLNGQAVTTSPPGQVLIVNGPVRVGVGLNSGIGALGPGWRANLTIGRALRLLVTLTGGGAPGRLDRATLGHPGKLGFCIVEAEEVSPWEPLHVERGLARGRSAVTLLAADAPLSVSDHRSRAPEELAATLGWAAAVQWSPFWWPMEATSLFIVCPEHASLFADVGWTKADLRAAIYEAIRRPAGELRRGETTALVQQAEDDELVQKWPSEERILIVVAGGEAGRFSAVLGPSLGMDAAVVTKEVKWAM